VSRRPLSVFIYEPTNDKAQREDDMFPLGVNRESPTDPFEVLNKDAVCICEGVLGFRRNNWIFRQVKCVFSGEAVLELVLVQKRSWDVIKHGAAKFEFLNGVVIGSLQRIWSGQVEQSMLWSKIRASQSYMVNYQIGSCRRIGIRFSILGALLSGFLILTPEPVIAQSISDCIRDVSLCAKVLNNQQSATSVVEPEKAAKQLAAREAAEKAAKQLAAREAAEMAAKEALAQAQAQMKLIAVQKAELEKLKATIEAGVNKNAVESLSNSLPKEGSRNQTTKIVASGNRKALIFGNNQYSTVSPLNNAVADAKAMAEKLSVIGYEVTENYDVERTEMLDTLRKFTYSVKSGDEVVFFYAGHGVEFGGRNYLLPTDIRGDDALQVQDDAIELQRILDDMTNSKAKFTLAIVDACRDNPFKSRGRTIGGRGLAPTRAATGQMVIFSAGTGQQALDKLNESDKSPNGLFTRIFIDEMTQPNVPIDRVVKKVRQRVVRLAESVGHEQVPAIYDQVVGDFFFIRK